MDASSEDKKFCLKQGDNGCLRLDTSHAYFYQVQTQMWLCNVKYSDFCVCTFPEGKAEASLYVERIFPDDVSNIRPISFLFAFCLSWLEGGIPAQWSQDLKT